MCPACMASVVWALTGATAAGGLGAFVVTRLREGDIHKKTDPTSNKKDK